MAYERKRNSTESAAHATKSANFSDTMMSIPARSLVTRQSSAGFNTAKDSVGASFGVFTKYSVEEIVCQCSFSIPVSTRLNNVPAPSSFSRVLYVTPTWLPLPFSVAKSERFIVKETFITRDSGDNINRIRNILRILLPWVEFFEEIVCILQGEA